ncbi:MAG: SurA N-terminal domain-containing protein [Bacteroides sp.]|nr:SurA N-terminal domain-containing protein [Bacteroides sp.]MCM1084928.1 SurA N-terminal domain-containing protein [Bacteroides sp.]
MAIIGRIRKHAGLAVALIGIAIIGFVVQDAFGRRGQSAPPVAVINGETVSYSSFSADVDQITEQYKRAQGDVKITEEDMSQIRNMAWQRLVSDMLLNEACQNTGIQVTTAEMNDMYYGKFISPYLYQYFTNPQTGVYDRQQVMNIINNFDQLSDQDKVALSELERIIKNERVKEKYNNLAAKSFYVPRALAAFQGGPLASTVTAGYVMLPYSRIADADLQVSKADFKKFYDENRFMFRQNKSRSLDYVVFDVTPTAQDMAEIESNVAQLYAEFQQETSIPDFVNAVTSGQRFDSLYRSQAEIFPGWDTLFNAKAGTFFAPRRMGRSYQMAALLDVQMRPDSIQLQHIFLSYTEAGSQSGRNKEQSRQLADSLKNVINANPGDFAQLAATYSEDPSAQQNGGDLGWQRDGYFVSYLNRAILDTKAGTAAVVEAPAGFHVIYVAAKTQPVKKVLAAVVNIPIEPSAATTKNIYTRANQLLGQCKGKVTGLDSAARQMGMQVRQASVTELESNLPGANGSREVIRWAYNKDSKEGTVANQVFEMENRYIIAGLRSINEDEYMPLERAMLIPQAEQLVKQEKKAKELSKLLMGGNTLQELASALDIEIDTAFGIRMNSYPMIGNAYEPKVIGEICGLEKGVLSQPVQGNAGVYRVMVNDILSAPADPMQINNIVRSTQMQMQQSASSLISSALENAAKIEDNREFYF